ncbi:hypothetical protein EST38_g5500 [Candolleomyces aberdarensis]|uniref:Uncharacterized protein n=1 Tax=Candolleomyces aberdarensis TaxID=2316362 RepID=A0A4Q2DKA5_9AGAR|nr:hypothetical protein EST38_g5500 [Candolleomyces aberdarensis]
MNVLELPAEILGKIFDHYVHERWKVRQVDTERPLSKLRRISAYSDSQTHPVDLTHTCRLWRTTAISMPQLWATIHAFEIASEGDVKMFELWLERSAGSGGTHPMSLSIEQKESRGQEVPVQPFGKVISLAISQHQRWRDICLVLYADSQPFLKPLYSVASLPTLSEFQVDLDQWDLDALSHLIGALCSSPALQSVKFRLECFNNPSANLLMGIVPWDRLTTLSFFALQARYFILILSSSMDTLQKISISTMIGSHHVDSSTSIPYVTMRRLQFIRIESLLFGFNASETFDKLILPSLRELYLPKGFTDGSRGWESLLGLLERSDCKLQALEIGEDETTELIENLKSPLFEHLTSLGVTSTRATDASTHLLVALSEAREDIQMPRMLPLLETLRLDSVRSEDSVQEMVSARVAAYAPEEYAWEMNLHDRE